MSLNAKYLNAKFLKTLEPLSKLSMDKLNELANKSTIETLPPARILFRQGERDARSIFILSGQIELTVAGSRPETLKAKTLEAKYPVAQSLPRPSTGKTKTNCELLYIDTDLLEILLDGDDIPSGNYEVTEINAEDDANGWMLKFLQSRAFLSLPTENIQKLLIKMQEITAKRGDVILKQGESNDYYYIVKQGKCSVSRRPTPTAEEVQVAILSVGDGFGEEALITDGKRNATVKMMEDGALMRLTKTDFIHLLVEPLIQYIDEDELKRRCNAGDMLIDVRQHKEFMDGHLDGAMNIPLSMLRLKLNGLNENREYLIYCENANRSSAAAFLIIQHGLVCRVLQDGYTSDKQPTISADERPKKSGTSMADIIANLESVGNRIKADQNKQAQSKAATENKSKPVTTTPISKNSDATTSGKAETHKTAPSEKPINDSRAKLFQIEARKAKEQLETLNQEKSEQQAARHRAEAELKRIKEEEQKRNEALRKMADQQRQSAEQAKRDAEIERQKLQAEINQAKQQAEEEIQKYRQILQQQQNHQSSLERSKQEFELQAQEAIAEAKRRAEQEATVIRQQAESETNRLREELEKTKREVAQRIDALRTEETRKIEQETKARAEEAKRIEREIQQRTNEAKKAEQAIQIKQSQANQAIRESIEKARQKAAQEADIIRRQALEEAQRLQAELESKRLEVSAEIEQIRHEAEEQRQLALNEARKHAEDFISQTSADVQRKALEEADAIRQETLVEARRLHEELEEKRRLIELHATKENEKMLQTLELTKQQADAIRRQAEQEAERIRLQAIQEAENQKNSYTSANARLQNDLSSIEVPGYAPQMTVNEETDTEIEAKKLAEQIISRLERAEVVRNKEKESNQNNQGMQLSSARLRKIKDKTILEGDEDIFIFKEPSFDALADFDDDDDEDAQAPIKRSKHKKTNYELPDFVVDETDNYEDIKYEEAKRDEAEFLLVDEESRVNSNGPISEFSDFELHDSKNYTNPFIEKTKRRNQKSRLFALAATLMIAIGGTGAFFYINQSDENMIANSTDSNKSLNATRLSGMGIDKVQLEKDLINDAEAEFSKLMKKWQKNDTSKSEINKIQN